MNCVTTHDKHCHTPTGTINVRDYLLPFTAWIQHQRIRQQVIKEREELAGLPLRMLRDIGVDPVDADKESHRAASDLPDTRWR